MDTSLNKPSDRSSAIIKHLTNIYGCTNTYNGSHFLIIIKARNVHHLSVL